MTHRMTKTKFSLLLLILPMLLSVSTGCTNQREAALETQLSEISAAVSELVTSVARMETIQAYQSTQIGAAASGGGGGVVVVTTSAPPPYSGTITPTPTAHTTVYGSVVVEDGICCAGGQAGDEIQIQVDFDENSYNIVLTRLFNQVLSTNN